MSGAQVWVATGDCVESICDIGDGLAENLDLALDYQSWGGSL
jgi:hypothetical protein